MTEELKNCAHCGSELITDYSDSPYYPAVDEDIDYANSTEIQCDECKVIAPTSKAWNRRASPWVSVEDELPDEHCGRLLVRLRDSTVTLDVSYKDGRGFIGPFVDYSPCSGEITHWMPIPPLPEKE